MAKTDHWSEWSERPWIPNHLSFLIKQNKAVKYMCNILNGRSCDNKYRDQWDHELNATIDRISGEYSIYVLILY